MAIYLTVSPSEATGKVKDVYDDIMATKEIVFKILRCIPHKLKCSRTSG